MRSCLGSFILFFIILSILGFFLFHPTASIANEIEDDSNFNYNTSIVGNYDSQKARVYTSRMSVPKTAEYIIRKQRPEAYTDLNSKHNIQLYYDDYYILIYMGEDMKTYVQISSREYIHHNGYGGLYRPYNRNIILFYGNSYTNGRYFSADRQRYGSGGVFSSKSIRKGSSSSKSSLGGGVSFGK